MTSINIRVDEELKRSAESLYQELGFNLSAAVTMFMRSSVRYGGIPFELRLERPNTETREALDDALQHRNLSGPYNTLQELMGAANDA